MAIKINYKKCCWKDGKCTSCSCGGACEGCVEACPVGALKREDRVIFDASKCIDCGACVNACKHNAISYNGRHKHLPKNVVSSKYSNNSYG